MCLKNFLDGPSTAKDAGVSASQRAKAVADGLLVAVTNRSGEVQTHKTGSRGRPATIYKLTPKGRREAQKDDA